MVTAGWSSRHRHRVHHDGQLALVVPPTVAMVGQGDRPQAGLQIGFIGSRQCRG
jgi:hypothetical protein